ncbi:MAG: translocation/assembly module TamB domain-containing protein [Pseudomonadota bacterium]
MKTICRHYLTAVLLSIGLLLYTPVQGEMTISVTSNLDTLDYDLENIHLRLEKLESRWQLSPIDSKLSVDKLRAQRLIITMRSAAKKAGDSALPASIKLPFPISIEQAEVLEVLIITPTEQHTLNNVQFDLEADAKTIQLNSLSVGTPYGQVAATLNLGTTYPFVLAGAVSIKQTNNVNTNAEQAKSGQADLMPYDVKVNLSGDLTRLQFDSTTDFMMENNQLVFAQTNSQHKSAVAKIQLTGELGLTGEYPLKANMQIAEFKPERLGAYPTGQFNFDLNMLGNLVPAGNSTGLQVLFSAKDSYLQINSQRQPFVSEGKLTIIDGYLQDIDFKANISSNSLAANGRVGATESRLDWRADLLDLSTFGNQFSGEARANGTLAGALESLAFNMDLAAKKLKLPNNIKLEKLDGKAELLAGGLGKVAVTLNASGLKLAQNPALNADFVLQGTRADHQMKIQAVETQSLALDSSKAMQFESTLQGGLEAGLWKGFIQTLNLTGEAPVTLQAPAKLSFTGQDVSIRGAILQLAKGRAVIDVLNAGNSGFISKGNLSNLALDDIPPSLFELPAQLQGNPVFSAQWDINAVETANGNLIFNLQSGDLNVLSTGGVIKPLGLQNAKAEIKLQNNQVNFVMQINGRQLGNVDVQVNTMLTKVESGFALMADAPLNISSHAQLNTLAWLPLSDSLADAYLDGELSVKLQADGTVQRPNLRGHAIGQNLQFMLPSQGVALTDGSLDAVFENDELNINQAVWKGGDGYLRTTGTLKMKNQQPDIALDWVAEQFTVISGTDRLLILNGTGKTTLDESVFSIAGDFKVVKGLLELPDEDTPTLADDVIVLGQIDTVPASALKVLLSGLRIDLGDDFKLRGRGLDAQLTGAVSLMGLTQYHPHAEGNIRVVKGTYMAYGQTLNITRGIISFSGPIDNPGLNIRAMRNALRDGSSLITTNAEAIVNTDEITGSNFSQTNAFNTQTVNAGVEITGSGLNPRVKLVSEPNVPDTEKLSWLVLGHGTDQAGKNDFAMLSLAAGAVLSNGDSVPLQTKLARAAGLDEFGFGGADAESASLTFGKRLTSRLYLSYEKSVSGLLDVARLTFNITPRWAIQAETGTESAVDALYTFSFK